MVNLLFPLVRLSSDVFHHNWANFSLILIYFSANLLDFVLKISIGIICARILTVISQPIFSRFCLGAAKAGKLLVDVWSVRLFWAVIRVVTVVLFLQKISILTLNSLNLHLHGIGVSIFFIFRLFAISPFPPLIHRVLLQNDALWVWLNFIAIFGFISTMVLFLLVIV